MALGSVAISGGMSKKAKERMMYMVIRSTLVRRAISSLAE